jgi:hypothetical protein
MDQALIIKEADEAARKEIEKHGTPYLINYEVSRKKAAELAAKLSANPFVVELGAIFMDFKLGESIKEGKQPEHEKISSDAAAKFLEKYAVPQNIIFKIKNCIEAHHKKIPFSCIEAEICANADCYRFLSLQGMIGTFMLMGARKSSYEDTIKLCESKFNEKLNILSFGVCKEELEEDIGTIRKFLDLAKKK